MCMLLKLRSGKDNESALKESTNYHNNGGKVTLVFDQIKSQSSQSVKP